MIRALITNWWLLLLRGLFALAFAVLIALLQPLFPSLLLEPMASTAVAEIFGLLAVVTGIFTIFAALKGATHHRDLWMLLLDGVAVTAGGLAVILIPAVSVVEVIKIIAATALAVGILEVIAGTHVRRHMKDEWFLIAGGLISMVFSVFLFLNTSREIAWLLNWIAIYAAANGLAMLGLARRLHALRHTIHELSSPEHLAHAAKKA
jgi:uncharacterized membrane protein HdeD (DUF308 family)